MSSYRTKLDERFGHRVLDPRPSREEIDRFFEEQYYDLIDKGERSADIGRARRGGEEALDQEKWFRETVHQDIIDLLLEHAPGKRVAEIGCGLGNLLNDMKHAGLDPVGIDLADAAVKAVRDRGLKAIEGSIDTLVESGEITPGSFDAIVFNNVLEYATDPLETFRATAKALAPGGVLVVRGGNDFNDLQLAAAKAHDLKEWWISAPEHLNYLNYEAIESLMREVGVAPFHRHGEFPMEMWILLGFDYISDRSLGDDCHKRRVAFERSLPTDVRRRLYRAFGEAGFGRTLVVAGKRG